MAADEEKSRARGQGEQALAILESVTDAIFALDRDFRFSYLNRSGEQLLHRNDLVGKNIWEEFPAARGTRFQDAYERAMWKNERVDFVEYYPAPLDRWYQVRAYPSPDGVAVYFQDITERRSKDEAYRRQRDQFELVVRGADVGVWYCPLPFDVLVWDDKVKEHFHLPPDAIVTIDLFYERLHPDDRERTRAAIAASVANRTHYAIDYRTVSADGLRTKWIHALGRTFYDEAGNPAQFDGVTMDVSARKEAELAIVASEERFRLAMLATNDVVWDWHFGTNAVAWNKALELAFGYVRSPVTNTAAFWKEHVHPDDHERVVATIHRTIGDPTADHWVCEYRFCRADGTAADVLDRGYVQRDAQGRAIRMIGAMQDVTARKRVERERERMIEAERTARAEAERQSRVKDEFLATLSHELRTPLNAVQGWAHILLGRCEASSDFARGLEVIARNARAQTKIVDDLLDMSRMLAGKIPLDVHPVDVDALTNAAIESARPAAEAKDISLETSRRAARAALVRGDSGRLQQIFWNLLSNAIKFTPRGGRVQVAVEPSAGGVAVTVSDDGEGIGADFLPHVFDRFRQADGSTTRRHGGLGLGLSIVKQLVELHGGTVEARSEGPGKGSAFTVVLPPAVTDVAPSSPRDTRLPRPIDDAVLDGVRALVVDDEGDSRAFLCRLLEGCGAVAVPAESAEAAYQRLESGERFDVLLSDIGMPGEDGYSLLRRVRALTSEGRGDIPAIAVTAFTRAEDRIRAIEAGFLLHVAKPIAPAEVVSMVAAVTERRGNTGS